jgi:ABC-2 type transport system ATP-binding protein
LSDLVLSTENLTKHYGKQAVLSGVSINVKSGDIYGLVGKNGAGKTTFIRLISGLVDKDGGEIRLFGNSDFKEEISKVGFVIERPYLYLNNTATENLKLFCKLTETDEKEIEKVLKIVGLEDVDKKKSVGKYSLGMKQRLSLAIALIPFPKLLILDEPLNGLDPIGIHDLRNLLITLNVQHGITIVVSSHILDELSKVATRYGIINGGKLLGEYSAKDINTKEQYVKYVVNDSETAEKIIRNKYNSAKIEISDTNSFKLLSEISHVSEINKLLIQQDIELINVTTMENNLEDYFINLIGKDS